MLENINRLADILDGQSVAVNVSTGPRTRAAQSAAAIRALVDVVEAYKAKFGGIELEEHTGMCVSDHPRKVCSSQSCCLRKRLKRLQAINDGLGV